MNRTLMRAILAMMCIVGLSGASRTFAQTNKDSSRSARKGAPSSGPQVYTSANFKMVTDLDAKAAEELLVRLERMVKLVSGYFGRKNPRQIEMYVAKGIDAWPADMLATLEPQGIVKIREQAGVTMSLSLSIGGRPVEGKSVVYAYADRGVPQHEAVHAYCAQAFGSTGPVWYAEGMAEVGQYWRENDKSVNAHEVVIEYLKRSEIKPIKAIVDNPLETTGDSWQNYASRWALCHLLGFNENYTQRFKPLGLALLAEQRDVSFWSVYGTQAKEIDFEYRLFLKDIEPGYRVDLCTWDWKARGKTLKGKTTHKTQVKAGRGWQPAKIRVSPDTEYALTAVGEWKLTKEGDAIDVGGDAEGKGKLMGILFNDYVLGEPFEIGKEATFTPPSEGDLFLRCADEWGSLGDNSGTMNVTLRLADKK